MKILLATPLYPPEIGGPATYARFLENEIPKHGSSIKILKFSDVRKYPAGIRHILFFFKVLRRGRKFDVIFAQDAFSVALPSILAAKILSKPFIVRIPGDFAWEQGRQRFGVVDDIVSFQKKKYGWRVEFYRKIQFWIVRNADRVLAPSEFFANLVSGWMNGKRAVALYNGLDIDLIKSYSRQKENKYLEIISSGRMVNWKGFDSLIELVSRNPKWRLSLVGDGPELENLKDLSAKLNVKERVIFLGKLDQNKLWEKISESDVFVLNSSFESFSFQVVEAMSLGLPVIATTGCNLGEIITDGREGFLVPPQSQISLGKAIAQIKDTNLRRKMGALAKIKSEEFSIKKTAEKLLGICKELV